MQSKLLLVLHKASIRQRQSLTREGIYIIYILPFMGGNSSSTSQVSASEKSKSVKFCLVYLCKITLLLIRWYNNDFGQS